MAETRARALLAIERIAAREVQALGMALDLRDASGTPLRSGDDARGARLEGLAIAVPGSEDDASKVLVITAGLLDASGEPLFELLRPLWESARAPYLVFADAHRAAGVFRARELAAPPRFGCVRVAATLVARGADRRRDHRPLERMVRERLELELPEFSQDAPAGERLACEADALLVLMRELMPQLRSLEMAPVYAFECGLLPTVIDMERAGVGVDGARFEQIASSWVRERKAIEAMPEAERDSARIARLDKLVSTYRYWARDFIDPDGRMRCRLHPLATDSGRFSCTEPNLQQVPSEYTAPGLRACFVPAPGTRFVIADYAQIELRVAAHLAPCDALRAVFLAGRDPHRATAATLTGKPESAIDDHERKLAKAINFGFLFGMGAKRFRSYAASSYGLDLSESDAQAAREAFFQTYPGISAWHRRTSALSRRGEHETVTVTTAMGRGRSFPAGNFSFNAALNIPVQGTAAEGFKRAMMRLGPALEQLGGRGVLIVHDEYIAEVPEAEAEAGRAEVEAVMVAAMQELVTSVPIVVEAAIGEHWS